MTEEDWVEAQTVEAWQREVARGETRDGFEAFKAAHTEQEITIG